MTSPFDRWLTTEPEPYPTDWEESPEIDDTPDPCEKCDGLGIHGEGCPTLTPVWHEDWLVGDADLYDDQRCHDCGTPIGLWLEEYDDHYGREVARDRFTIYVEYLGRLLCEDCYEAIVNPVL